jgi:hypothetical protein
MGKAALWPLAWILVSVQGCSFIPAVSPGWLVPIGIVIVTAVARLLMWMSKTDVTLKVLGEALDRSTKAQEEIAKALQRLVAHEERIDQQEEKSKDHEDRIRALERGSSPPSNR